MSSVESFRAEVRQWLAENVPTEPLPPWTEGKAFDLYRDWERRLFAAGYSAVAWPTEYGGRSADLLETMAFAEEYIAAGGPERVTGAGLMLLGPVLMQYGTEEQRSKWLPDLLSAATIWCQGFSEPESGSDLASLRTRADRDGDHFIVNGQKIWTSFAIHADWIFALVRTDVEAGKRRKHDGISFLCIDLRTPGVEVRPLPMVDGTNAFAEVFFTDVRVPVENVVGEIGRGWSVAMSTLGFERGSMFGDHAKFSRDVESLAAFMVAQDRADDELVLDQIGRAVVETEVYRANVYRLAHLAEQGASLDSTASINKVYWTEMQHDIFATGLKLMGGDAAVLDEPACFENLDPLTRHAWREWHHRYWYARAAMIYGGTNEIQRNIISERLLGLPQEPRTA